MLVFWGSFGVGFPFCLFWWVVVCPVNNLFGFLGKVFLGLFLKDFRGFWIVIEGKRGRGFAWCLAPNRMSRPGAILICSTI